MINIGGGVIQMAIADDKTRTLITLKKTDKARLEKIAKEQNRSFNNLIETILLDFLKREQS